MEGLTAWMRVPTAATERAQSPIFSVIDQVVFGLMTLINMRCSSQDQTRGGVSLGPVAGRRDQRGGSAQHRRIQWVGIIGLGGEDPAADQVQQEPQSGADEPGVGGGFGGAE